MSDIIYTSPASSGTTINPTNNYIPKRSNATTFVDSVLRTASNNNDDLGTFVGGIYNGFLLDFINRSYQFGAVSNDNLTKLVINDSAQFIGTYNLNEPKGLYIEYPSQRYYLGDWNYYDNGTSIVINDATQNIYTTKNNVVDGLNLDFAGNNYMIGDNNNNYLQINATNQTALINLAGVTYFLIDIPNSNINIGDAGTPSWIELNSFNKTLKLGDINSTGNATQINVDESSNSIQLRANSGGVINLDYTAIAFNGPTSPTASGPADHLEVNVNGTPYKIQLLNP